MCLGHTVLVDPMVGFFLYFHVMCIMNNYRVSAMNVTRNVKHNVKILINKQLIAF